jgi:hypothetical protein
MTAARHVTHGNMMPGLANGSRALCSESCGLTLIDQLLLLGHATWALPYAFGILNYVDHVDYVSNLARTYTDQPPIPRSTSSPTSPKPASSPSPVCPPSFSPLLLSSTSSASPTAGRRTPPCVLLRVLCGPDPPYSLRLRRHRPRRCSRPYRRTPIR